MEALIRTQDDFSDKLSKGLTNYKKAPLTRRNKSYIEARLQELEKTWTVFCNNHGQLIKSYSKQALDESSYVIYDTYGTAEEQYFEYKATLIEALKVIEDSSSGGGGSGGGSSGSGSKNTSYHVKLPKISIPTFSGKYTEWTTFKDLYKSLIHNNQSLDKVQKLHYLKGYLSGEAEQLLRHIPITESNYDDCWTKLVSRYDNKRFLSNNILNRFMSQKQLQAESSVAIKELLDTMNECLSALTNIGVDISTWDIIVIYIMSQKLDSESRKEWEAKATESDNLPTLVRFIEFLEHKYKSLEFLSSKSKPKVNIPNTKQNVFHAVESDNSSVNVATSHAGTSEVSCLYCKANHKLVNCKQFAKQEYDVRHDFIKTTGLCFNCFGAGHSVFSCRQTMRCRSCNRKHHSLIHPKTVSDDTKKDSGSVSNTAIKEEPPVVNTCFSTTSSQVLLATTLVKVGNNTLRCLLDQGSQASFITEDAVQTLGLKKLPHNIYVSGVGSKEGESLMSRWAVSVKFTSIHDPSVEVTVKAHVLTKVTNLLPARQVVSQQWPELANLKLADSKFGVPGKIDLLLGAEVYSQILTDGLLKVASDNTLLVQNTLLGWVVSGKVETLSPDESGTIHSNIVISMFSQCSENEQLRKFWEIESDIYPSKKILTPEEQKCEDFFLKTTKRDKSGRYVVKLQLNSDNPKCKDGRLNEIARRSLISLEKRLEKTPDLKPRYGDVIKEYLDMGHMELVPVESRNRTDVVYLPHHAIVREERTTTKVRVVFNASCPGVNGVSLNNELMVGPRLQDELRHIVMRWRQHPICLIADIVKCTGK